MTWRTAISAKPRVAFASGTRLVEFQIGRRARSGPLFSSKTRAGSFRRMGNFDLSLLRQVSISDEATALFFSMARIARRATQDHPTLDASHNVASSCVERRREPSAA